MAPSKAQRWLDILAVLIGHRYPVPADRLMEKVPAYRDRLAQGDANAKATVQRMFERDKDGLRRLGIPLETRPSRPDGTLQTGYCISRHDFYLPYLRVLGDEPPDGRGAFEAVTLSEDDARLAIRAIREVLQLPSFPFVAEAHSALRKLTFDLDPALADTGPGGGATTRILDRPGGADPQRSLGTLLDGLYDRRRVTFRYHSIGRDALEPREVEPWGLLYQWGGWYLVGRDADGSGDETDGPSPHLFRLDRMSEARAARPAATRPEFEVPDTFDLRDYANRKAWELGGDPDDRTEVEIRFLPPASLLAARNGWGELTVERDDGSQVRRFAVAKLDPLLRWVLAQGGEAEVVSPADAAERLREMARRVLDLYGGQG